jgi:hypothetical protein
MAIAEESREQKQKTMKKKKKALEWTFVSLVSFREQRTWAISLVPILHLAAPGRRIDSQSLSHECSARKSLPRLASVGLFGA